MVTAEFCNQVLGLFTATETCWAQLHTSDPGDRGDLGQTIDRRRQQVQWQPVEGVCVATANTLRWDNFQGIPGYPARIQWLSLWSAPEAGKCWASIPLMPMSVPHLATFEIPVGIKLEFSVMEEAW